MYLILERIKLYKPHKNNKNTLYICKIKSNQTSKQNMDSGQGSGSFLRGLNFQRIVIIIAIIMLIVAMIFIGHALYRQSIAGSWPPETPKCPDYYTFNGSTCVTPKPTQVGATCEYNGIPAGTQGMPACT